MDLFVYPSALIPVQFGESPNIEYSLFGNFPFFESTIEMSLVGEAPIIPDRISLETVQ